MQPIVRHDCPMDALRGGHGEVVAHLVDRVRGAQTGDRTAPRVVLLRGPSGMGKSRIIRELYDELRAAEQPPYWPDLPGATRQATRQGIDPMASRKVLSPDLRDGFDWRSGAVPTFGWWSFDCALLAGGGVLDVVASARPQLDAHLLPLLMAWREKAGLGDKLRAKRKDVLEEVRSAAVDETQGALLEVLQTLDIAIPFAGTLAKWGWKGYRGVRQRQHDAALLQDNVDVSEAVLSGARASGEELARIILSVCHPEIPALLVIEDMHLMGIELSALLKSTAQSAANKPALVIGTIWPEGQDNADFVDWMHDLHDLKIPVELIDVPELSELDLCGIVWDYAPNTTLSTAMEVARAMPNPHFLKLWLTLGSTQRHIRKNSGKIRTYVAVDQTLPDIHQVLRARWFELSADTRDVLLLALAAKPQPGHDDIPSFVPDIISSIAQTFDDVDSAVSLRALSLAAEASWTLDIDGVLYLRESDLARVVREELPAHFDADDIREIQDIALRALGQWLETRSDGLRVPINAQAAAVAGDLSKFLGDPDPFDERALLGARANAVLGGMAEVAFNYASASKSLAAATAWAQGADATVSDKMGLEWRLANCLGRSGQVAGAFAGIEVALNLAEAEGLGGLGAIRVDYAHWLGLGGRIDSALEVLRRVEGELDGTTPADMRVAMTARLEAAVLTAKLGRVELALDELYDVSRLCEASFGANDSLTLVSLQELGHWAGMSGNPAHAVEIIDRAKGEMVMNSGVDYERALKINVSLDWWRCKAGLASDPVRVWEDHLKGHTLNLGESHPDTLTVRGNLAHWVGESGDVDRAILLLQDLEQRRDVILGPLHPKTLRTKHALSRWLRKAGRLSQALKMLDSVVESRHQVLGARHPDTRETVAERALCQFLLIPTSESAAAVDLAIDRLAEVLGLENPTVQEMVRTRRTATPSTPPSSSSPTA